MEDMILLPFLQRPEAWAPVEKINNARKQKNYLGPGLLMVLASEGSRSSVDWNDDLFFVE